jgi:hypothetical protein
MQKKILAAQREIVQGYYNRIIMQKPDLEIILQWLENDLEYLSQEDAVEGVNDIIMNYHPHEVSKVECSVCKHSWVAVRQKGLQKLECPNCELMVDFENVG